MKERKHSKTDMSKSLNKATVIILCLTMLACNNSNQTKESNIKTYAELDKASWLLGSWQNKSIEGTVTEVWEKANDSTFHGTGYFVLGKDTVSSEKISLIQKNNELFYVPTVKDQNAGQPVSFKLTSASNNQLVFENPRHDFPQKITYTKISPDSLIAVISGIVNGNENSQKFPMTRAK